MVWFKVDDSLSDHPKILALQELRGWEPALALWTLAGAWSSKHLTDGSIPAAVVLRLGSSARAAALLVDVGLWELEAGGYRFHDWQSRNPIRAQVEQAREATRNRVARHRGNGVTPAASNGVTRTVTDSVTPQHVTPLVTGAPSRPVPARPDQRESTPRAELSPGLGGPPESVTAAAQLSQAFADRTGRLMASSADMTAARGIVAQVGDRWPDVLEAWLADDWIRQNRPPLSNLEKNAHKYTAPAPVDPAELEEQIRRARERSADLTYRAKLELDNPGLELAASEARAVLEELRSKRKRVA